MDVVIDFETRSRVDLKEVGGYKYASDPTTEVICLGVKIEDEPSRIWVNDGIFTGRKELQEFKDRAKLELFGDTLDRDSLQAVIDRADKIYAHNAKFEEQIWKKIMYQRYGFSPLPEQRVRCLMAMCYYHTLPGSLDKAGNALGLDITKDDKGHRHMLKVSKPRRGGRKWWDDAHSILKLANYCLQDCNAERAVLNALPRTLPENEYKIFIMDKVINEAGVPIDKDSVEAVINILENEELSLIKEFRRITDGKLKSPRQVKALKDWMKSQGFETDTVAKAYVEKILKQEDLPSKVRRVLEIRAELGKSSTGKFKKMIQVAMPDNRLYYTTQFYASRTGRWGGRHFQPHNIPRPEFTPKETEDILEFFRNGDVRAINLLYGDIFNVASNCIRGCIQAPEGYEFIGADLSQIEGRLLAWFAHDDALDVYADESTDPYIHAAMSIFNKKYDEISGAQRNVGKVAELALGYQGGKRAFLAMAEGYGVKVSQSEAEAIKKAWRNARPKTVRFWYKIEKCAVRAVKNPGEKVVVQQNPDLVIMSDSKFMYIKLPTGNVLHYARPTIEPKLTPWGEEKMQLHYLETHSQTYQWVKTNTYGGKLTENVMQATGRNILADGLIRLYNKGYKTVLHVHDEALVQVKKGEGTVKEVCDCLTYSRHRLKGLPLKAEGWRGRRYRK